MNKTLKMILSIVTVILVIVSIVLVIVGSNSENETTKVVTTISSTVTLSAAVTLSLTFNITINANINKKIAKIKNEISNEYNLKFEEYKTEINNSLQQYNLKFEKIKNEANVAGAVAAKNVELKQYFGEMKPTPTLNSQDKSMFKEISTYYNKFITSKKNRDLFYKANNHFVNELGEYVPGDYDPLYYLENFLDAPNNMFSHKELESIKNRFLKSITKFLTDYSQCMHAYSDEVNQVWSLDCYINTHPLLAARDGLERNDENQKIADSQRKQMEDSFKIMDDNYLSLQKRYFDLLD